MDVENPIAFPVAEMLKLEVVGSPLIEEEDEEEDENRESISEPNACAKIILKIELVGIVMFGLAFLGAFLLFLVWCYNPSVFGQPQ
jgi:hypothetical protein